MAHLVNIPQGLKGIAYDVSCAYGRQLEVMTSPVLSFSGSDVVARPESIGKMGVLPVYVPVSPAMIDGRLNLMPKGEYLVGRELARCLACTYGYKKPDLQFPVLVKRRSAQRMMNILGRISASNVVRLSVSLASRPFEYNILVRYGYHPTEMTYEPTYRQILPEITKSRALDHRYAVGDIGQVARSVMFPTITLIAEFYLFLPEEKREEMLIALGPFWKSEILSLLANTGLQFPYHFLSSPEFLSEYTPAEYHRAANKAVEFFAGDNFKVMHSDKKRMKARSLMMAKRSVKNGDLFRAYVRSRQNPAFRAAVKKGLLQLARRTNPQNDQIANLSYLRDRFMERRAFDAALDIQEDILLLEPASR